MKSANTYFSLLIFFIVYGNTTILAQNNFEEKNYYKWFDQNIGHENTALFNGELYKKSYRTEDRNHNFFNSNNFVIGAVEFDNQSYFDILLKYDIYQDELIAKLKSLFKGNSHIQLNKAFIKGFTIDNKNFKFINITTETITLNGFYEISHSGNILTLYTKHNKLKEDYIVDKLIYSKFSKKDKNIILYQNNYYEINSKKDLKKIFPNQKKEINVLYKRNKRLKKSNKNAFTKEIVRQIEQNFNGGN